MTREQEIERLKSKLQAADDLNTLLTAELGKAKSPWISVEDRLPEENGKYYVIAGGIPDMSLYKNGKWVTAYKERKNVGSHFVEEVEMQDFEYSHTDLTGEVTHWMPIPELSTTK